MRRPILAILSLAVLLASIVVMNIHLEAAPANASPIRVSVKVSGDVEAYIPELSKYGTVIGTIPEINIIVMEINPSYAKSLSALVRGVKFVEEDKPIYRKLQEVQWDIQYIYAPNVWSTYYQYYGDAAYGYHSAIQVAIVDTGIDYTHTDLYGAVKWCVVSLNNGATFYKGTNLKNCRDLNGHGTHVAGTVAARLNGVGMAGVAPKAQLYAVRVLSASGSGYITDIARGIVEAVKGPDGVAGTADDADVISMSLGGPHSDTLYNAVVYAYNNGAVLVAASGNEGASSPSYPAAYSEVIAVGAIDSNYAVPSWSNRNPDVVAPGVNIYSTLPGGKYGYMSGTSMACPHVSGVVALIQALRLAAGKPKLSPSDVMYFIMATAIDLGSSGYDSLYGYGLVDAEYAVYYALRY